MKARLLVLVSILTLCACNKPQLSRIGDCHSDLSRVWQPKGPLTSCDAWLWLLKTVSTALWREQSLGD